MTHDYISDKEISKKAASSNLKRELATTHCRYVIPFSAQAEKAFS